MPEAPNVKPLSQFNEAITRLLTERLKRFTNNQLDLVTCTEIFQVIFNSLIEVFEMSNIGISNEAMNFLAQSYYDSISVNGTAQELDPNIFSQRAKLENIETRELALLAVMLNGTDFAIPLIHEIKRRS